MNQEISQIVTSLPPSVAVLASVVAVVAVVFVAKKLLPAEYCWQTEFSDLLVDNLGDHK